MIDSLVIATDGSQSVTRAVGVAMDLADRFDATVHALYVIDSTEINSTPTALQDDLNLALERHAEKALTTIHELASTDIVSAVRTGRPETEIVNYVREQDIDLVSIGTRGRHGEHRFLLGSVAEAVVQTCPVPVLSVRQLEGE